MLRAYIWLLLQAEALFPSYPASCYSHFDSTRLLWYCHIDSTRFFGGESSHGKLATRLGELWNCQTNSTCSSHSSRHCHSQKLPHLEAEERYATGIGGPTSAAELRRMALGPEGRNVQVAKAVYSFGVTKDFSFRCTNSQDGNGAGTIEKVEGVAI